MGGERLLPIGHRRTILRTMGLWHRAVERQGYAVRPLGDRRRTGDVRLGIFPADHPAFPRDSTDALIARAALPGLLGNKHASGTDIIAEFGEEHMRTGKPIIYTSADSVIQIAAHEESFGLERLYEVCEIARELSLPLNIGRVIARPFVGAGAQDFARTGNRKDYSIPPPSADLLDRLSNAGREVVSVGKIGDIYAHSGTGREIKTVGNDGAVRYDARRHARTWTTADSS